MNLIQLTSPANGDAFWVNAEHITAIHSRETHPNGGCSEVFFAASSSWLCVESARDVVEAIGNAAANSAAPAAPQRSSVQRRAATFSITIPDSNTVRIDIHHANGAVSEVLVALDRYDAVTMRADISQTNAAAIETERGTVELDADR
jgi:hypothetical protein